MDGRANETATAAADRARAEKLIARLRTPEGQADPYPVYAELRRIAPVHRSEAGPVYLSTYEDCLAVTRDPAFRAQGPEWLDGINPTWRERPARVATIESMLFRDPPDHTRLRRLVSAAFTPRRLAALGPEIDRLVRVALDTIADAGGAGGPVDLHAILSATLPISVIGALVGVPDEDRPLLQESMTAMMRVVELAVDRQMLDEADRGAERLLDYFAALVADRRRTPRGDLASALVTAKDAAGGGIGGAGGAADEGLSETELLQTLILLFMAGVDTMVNHLANGTAALLDHPDQLDALRADPSLAATAPEEMLRYDAPIQILGRVAGTDLEFGGHRLPAGTLMICLLGAANRDPARFDRPDRLELARTGMTALSFGGGMHYCLGAPLARMESAAFFPALLERFPKLARGGEPVRRGMVFRGFAKLPVTVA